MKNSFKVGDVVYLKKTGEKFTITNINKSGYTIEDGLGMEFDNVKGTEFKNKKVKL